nr:MAG TPA: hypothetical protein [Caudoviricetes sp.]
MSRGRAWFKKLGLACGFLNPEKLTFKFRHAVRRVALTI